MNFYLDIANSLYINTTEINGTHFYDRYEYIEIKHTESQFKGKVFYQNLINELVKHWRAKTPLSRGEHFSDDCISLVNYCKEKIAEVSGSEILKNVDIKYNLDVDFPEDGFYKTLYDTHKRQIDRCGFYQITDNNVAVNIYHPRLAVILSSPREIPVYDSNRQVLNIDGWKFLDDYVSGYKNGISYFDENFAVDKNTLYNEKAEYYIRNIHKHYFHENHEGHIGWHFVKSSYPFIITHKVIYDYGYYSGIVSKVDEMVKKHAPLFKSFDKCECQSKQHDFDQKPEQATNETDNEAILLIKLEMFFCSSQKYQTIMELFVEKKYCQPGTYIWKDEKNGNKSFLASVLKYLHKQGYLKDNKKLTNPQIQLIAQNTFGWDIRLDTIKKAKPENFDLKFIPMASTID